MKVAKKTRRLKGLGTGAVMFLHPTMYEELSRAVLVDAGENFRTGEIGTLDCRLILKTALAQIGGEDAGS